MKFEINAENIFLALFVILTLPYLIKWNFSEYLWMSLFIIILVVLTIYIVLVNINAYRSKLPILSYVNLRAIIVTIWVGFIIFNLTKADALGGVLALMFVVIPVYACFNIAAAISYTTKLISKKKKS